MTATDGGRVVGAPSDDGFVDFANAASGRLLHTAWLLCGDEGVAEELVQEAIARAFAKWRRIRHDQPLAYTRRIVVNLNNDRWRRRQREDVSPIGRIPEGESTDRHRDVDDRDLAIRLLELLPRREREVVVLRHYAGLTEREVAATLGISIGTVKSTCSHGLSTLRAALANQQEN